MTSHSMISEKLKVESRKREVKDEKRGRMEFSFYFKLFTFHFY